MVLPLGGYSTATLLNAPKHIPLDLTLHTPCGASIALSKAPGESVQHLLLKGLLWSLLLPTHPGAACEVDLGLRFKPDVVAIDGSTGDPCWWGECGSVKSSKLCILARTYPQARFSVAKWGRSDLRGYANQLVSTHEHKSTLAHALTKDKNSTHLHYLTLAAALGAQVATTHGTI